jgi:hypothetical protein
MVEVGFFVKYADMTTAVRIRIEPMIFVTAITLFSQLFVKR